jgi:hypothetical protein
MFTFMAASFSYDSVSAESTFIPLAVAFGSAIGIAFELLTMSRMK